VTQQLLYPVNQSVTDSASQIISDSNEHVYQRLKLALSLDLRRQIFIAVCDDLALRDRLAAWLETELNPHKDEAWIPGARKSQSQPYPRLVSLKLNLSDPNMMAQIAQWLAKHPLPVGTSQSRSVMSPAFQVLGVEQLTRQPAAIQRLFLSYLEGIERSLPFLDSSLLVWLPQPWFHTVRQSAPEFWGWHTGIFEFVGDPTPVSPVSVITPRKAATATPRRATPPEAKPASEIWAILAQDLAKLSEATGVTPPTEKDNAKDVPTELPPADASESRPQRSVHQSTEIPVKKPTSAATTPPAPRTLTANGAAVKDALPQTGTKTGTKAEPIETPAKPSLPSSPPQPVTPLGNSHADRPTPRPAPGRKTATPPAPLPADSKASPAKPVDQEPIAQVSQARTKKEVAAAANPAIPTRESLAIPVNGFRPPVFPPTSFRVIAELAELVLTAAIQELGGGAILQAHLEQNGARLSKGIHALLQDLPESLSFALQNFPALQTLKQLDQLHQRHAGAPELIAGYRSLGDFYRDRIESGDPSPQNLVIAIRAYEQALEWLGQAETKEQGNQEQAEVYSAASADVLNDLGNLYWMLSRCPGSGEQKLLYLEQGIRAYQFALTKVNPELHSQSYAMIQNNLGAAFGDLARYRDPAENLQLSILAYVSALRFRQPETDPLKFASTQNNLGTAYWHLAQHQQPIAHLSQAIEAYTAALKYYDPEQEPLNYAMIQNNLGTAYWNLAQYDQSDDLLQLAIGSYRISLLYRTAEKSPAGYAATQNNLGTAYWHLANRSKDVPQVYQDSLQNAIGCYTNALASAAQLAPTPMTFDTFATQNNLGLAHYQLATDSHSALNSATKLQHLETALDSHLKALQGWKQQPEFSQTAMNYIVQTIRAIYTQGGIQGQNLALSRVPGHLLPELLPKL